MKTRVDHELVIVIEIQAIDTETWQRWERTIVFDSLPDDWDDDSTAHVLKEAAAAIKRTAIDCGAK